MARGIERPAPIPSELSSAIESYIDSEYFQQRIKSKNSKTAYKADLRFFSEYLTCVGVLTFGDIRLENVVGWVEQMLAESTTKPATIERRLSVVRTFLNFRKDNGLLEEDFIAQIPKIKDTRNLPFEVLGYDRYMALVEHLRQKGELRDLAIVELLVSTGADTTEIVNMNIGDISELESGQIAARFVKPRTGRERTVVLNDRTTIVLGEYLVQRKDPAQDQPLFTHKSKGPDKNRRLTRQGLWLRLQKYQNVIGVGVLNQRVFTNTFVDNFEGDIKGLADALGIGETAASKLLRKSRKP